MKFGDLLILSTHIPTDEYSENNFGEIVRQESDISIDRPSSQPTYQPTNLPTKQPANVPVTSLPVNQLS